MGEQACLHPGTQMTVAGWPLPQAFTVLCGWPWALIMRTGFLRVMWILEEAWPQACLGLYHPSLVVPEEKRET